MRQIIIIAMCFISFLAHAQVSGGQIRRPSSNKSIGQKQSSKKTPIKKRIKRNSSSTSRTESNDELHILEIIPITYATIDGKNISDEIIATQTETHLYVIGDDLYMMNYCNKDDTRSWGLLSILDTKEEPETSTQYGSLTLSCSWNYQNDYNNKKGTALVTIQMVNKGNGYDYTITIKADELVVYKGFASSDNNEDETHPMVSNDIIQPITISFLAKYNIVCASFSTLKYASEFCYDLRDKGYNAQIYLDSHNIYRIIINRFFSEQDALNFRNSIRSKYQDAWILYINNGKEERYSK